MCNTKEVVVEFTCIPSKAPCYHRLSFICPKLLNWTVLSCTLKYFTHISFTYPSLICPLRKTTWNRIPQFLFDMQFHLSHFVTIAVPSPFFIPIQRNAHGTAKNERERADVLQQAAVSALPSDCAPTLVPALSTLPCHCFEYDQWFLFSSVSFVRRTSSRSVGCFAFSSDTDRNNSGKIELHVLVNNCCTTQRENRFVSFIEIYLWFGLSPDSIRRQQQEEASSNKVSEFMCKDYSQSEPFAG